MIALVIFLCDIRTYKSMVGKIVLAEKTRTIKNVVNTLVIAFVIILCDVRKDFLVEKTGRNAVSTQVIALVIFSL